MNKWRAEKRQGQVIAETPVLQKLSDGWWLTDGVESFKMTSEFAAKTLASYLNQKQPS